MMPVKPSEFLAVVPLSTDTKAVAMRKTFIQFPPLLWRLMRYLIAPDGSGLGEEFLNDICNISCPQKEDTTE